MIRIALHNKLWLKFVTKDTTYTRAIKEHFTEKVSNYWFSPKFQAGLWTGDVSLFDGRSKTLPYGLLVDVLKFHKCEFPNTELKLDDDVKSLFKSPPLKIEFNLNLQPYPYQEECVRSILKYSKGIIRVATAGGKSLVIAYLINILRLNNLSKKAIIIVPTINLMNQFKSDLMDYGIDESLLGLVGRGNKEFDRQIIISTWQSLQNNTDKLPLFDTIVVDEVHTAQAKILKNILSNCINATFRFGFTGTMHEERLESLNTKAFLGPIISEYSASYLAEEGYISKCNVMMLHVEYPKEFKGDYKTIKYDVFNDQFRLSAIAKLINSIDDNFLLLVGLVHDEGLPLKRYLEENCPDRKVIFLHGGTDPVDREKWRHKAHKEKNIVLIATYQIFQLGINIPSLKFLILASPFKAKIRVLQSIGRTLRKYANKEKSGAYIIDLLDVTNKLERHGDIRVRFYVKEGFNVKDYFIAQHDGTDMDLLLKEIV
jgi:superfamily II DNA or RNA helicase